MTDLENILAVALIWCLYAWLAHKDKKGGN